MSQSTIASVIRAYDELVVRAHVRIRFVILRQRFLGKRLKALRAISAARAKGDAGDGDACGGAIALIDSVIYSVIY